LHVPSLSFVPGAIDAPAADNKTRAVAVDFSITRFGEWGEAGGQIDRESASPRASPHTSAPSRNNDFQKSLDTFLPAGASVPGLWRD
jgi:hypothetical protein